MGIIGTFHISDERDENTVPPLDPWDDSQEEKPPLIYVFSGKEQ